MKGSWRRRFFRAVIRRIIGQTYRRGKNDQWPGPASLRWSSADDPGGAAPQRDALGPALCDLRADIRRVPDAAITPRDGHPHVGHQRAIAQELDVAVQQDATQRRAGI